MSLKTISLASMLLTLPWLLKFLWAPFIDHRGTRRGWLLTLQLSALVVAAVITQLQLEGNYVLLFAAAFTFNLIAATQDIATDGLAVRMLDARELGLANGIQVGAYRIGMMFGGGLLLKILTLHGLDVRVRVHGGAARRHDDSGAPDARAAARRERSAPERGTAFVRLAATPADAGNSAAGRADLLLPLRRPAADDAARAVPDRPRVSAWLGSRCSRAGWATR